MKRILTIQDISCVGKCSLTVALPVISAMGVETAVLPTAVLSTHTAFGHFTIHDLTDDIPGIAKSWEEEKISFDAVYSGYLGSARQVRLVEDIWRRFDRGLRIVDPAMADGGALYAGFDADFVQAMGQLCRGADVITPNLTEACLLAGVEYRENPSPECCKDVLRQLADQGAGTVILTGYSENGSDIGALAYERNTGRFTACTGERIPVVYHGTGDIFASVLAGALTRGFPLERAVSLAVEFDRRCIEKTVEDPQRRWYGVNFEEALPWLVAQLSKRGKE